MTRDEITESMTTIETELAKLREHWGRTGPDVNFGLRTHVERSQSAVRVLYEEIARRNWQGV